MVRKYSDEYVDRWPEAEVVIADALNVGQLKWALKDVSVAYDLMHSMLIGKKYFASSDLKAVTNFRFVAEEMKLKRIIYLGALGETGQKLSSHLESRKSWFFVTFGDDLSGLRQNHLLPQQLKAGPPVHLPFNTFNSVDVAFNRSIAP